MMRQQGQPLAADRWARQVECASSCEAVALPRCQMCAAPLPYGDCSAGWPPALAGQDGKASLCSVSLSLLPISPPVPINQNGLQRGARTIYTFLCYIPCLSTFKGQDFFVLQFSSDNLPLSHHFQTFRTVIYNKKCILH